MTAVRVCAQVQRLQQAAATAKEGIRTALAPRQAAGAGAATASGSAAAEAGSMRLDAVEVVLRPTEGPYSGAKSFRLRFVPGAPAALIGRSTGKKFRESGVSLPKDGEVSTTHARIELAPDAPMSEAEPESDAAEAQPPAVVVVDADSTNGTVLDGVDLKPAVSYPLRNGAALKVGNTVFAVEIERRA